MKFFVIVKTKSSNEKVVKLDENNYKVLVKETPEKGRANKAVIKNLAENFKVSRSSVSIISGQTSNRKMIEVIIS